MGIEEAIGADFCICLQPPQRKNFLVGFSARDHQHLRQLLSLGLTRISRHPRRLRDGSVEHETAQRKRIRYATLQCALPPALHGLTAPHCRNGESLLGPVSTNTNYSIIQPSSRFRLPCFYLNLFKPFHLEAAIGDELFVPKSYLEWRRPTSRYINSLGSYTL